MKLMGNLFLFIILFLSVATQPAHLENLAREEERYYFEEGLKYYRAKNHELALENFLQVLELNPKNKLALKYVNRARDELKRRKEQELLNQAIKDYQDQNYEVALDKFVQVLDLDPKNTEAIDYIQKIKEETSLIERVKSKVISEQKRREAERPVIEEISRMAQDIEEIIKREVAKARLEEPKELPPEISEKRRSIMRILFPPFLLFGSVLIVVFFTYKGLISKRRGLTDKNLKLLEDLNKTATTTEHKGEILDTILKAFMETVKAKSGALLIVEDKTADLVLAAGVELRPDIPKDLRFNKESTVVAEIARITSPTSAAEVLKGSTYDNLLLFKKKPARHWSFLLVPLTYKNRNVGLVLLNSKRYKRNFLRENLGIIETLASQAAIIVANIAYDRQVIMDGLTGLYVHWFFYQCLEKEISRAERQDLSLALLMLDLDNFKQFNDTYGHPMGDKALVKVAENLKNDLRHIDTIARYGGEEFAIILPGVDEKLAFRTAERIRKGLESYRFQVANGQFQLTLSIGISIYEKGLSTEEMVERADKALYWVKQHGRNQVKYWRSLFGG